MNVNDDTSRLSMLELFSQEAQTQTRVLASELLTLEHAPTDVAALEACMRAAHSLKGAARIVGLQDGVDVAHELEECFVAVQRGELSLSASHIDELLRGVDLLLRVGERDPAAAVSRDEIDAFTARVSARPSARPQARPQARPPTPLDAPPADRAALADAEFPEEGEPQRCAHPVRRAAPPPAIRVEQPPSVPIGAPPETHRMLRVRADHLDKLLSLSGESLAESRWVKPFADSMLRIKRLGREAACALEALEATLTERLVPAERAALGDVRQKLTSIQHQLATHIDELDRRSTNLAQQLYDEALQCRMRPFGDAAHAYPRLVRDFARSLGKLVRFSIGGEATQVDRDILDMIDAPIGHLLRNALDHGVESPEVRVAHGKPAEANVTLDARHSAGKLLISVSDDGAGIDLQKVRATIVERRLVDVATAARLSDQELLAFLLLPGFSMREQVTDVSGRGVGLDAVHEMVKAVHGAVRIFSETGQGTRFVLQLPLTLSVVRSLLVDIGGQAYAFPLVHVRHTMALARSAVDTLEGQQHFMFDGRPVGLVTAHQLLGAPPPDEASESLAVVLIGNEHETYGVTIDRFLGERMLVVQPLDSRLGKVKDIAAAALMDNGEAALIVDVEDLLHSIDRLVKSGRLTRVARAQSAIEARRLHVLVVDDSLTVRELERKLLEASGYTVTIAVDGMDGWNALRSTTFDLVVTDVDMPRLDGIELVTLIKRDAVLKTLPVMIVSYKDRDEDRRRGLDAGADYYLAKSSFHDDALIDAVRELIGESGT
jgi:two-component system sensor histidine kinase and response regulator WspE